MGFKNRKCRNKDRFSCESKLLNNTLTLLHWNFLKRQPKDVVSKRKCNFKSSASIEKKPRKERYCCTKCDASYKYKKNLAQHLNEKHPSAVSSLKSADDKENSSCTRTLFVCLEKLSERDIPSSSKNLTLKKRNVEENGKRVVANNWSKSSHVSDQKGESETSTGSTRRQRFRCSKCQDHFSGELEFERHFESVHSHFKSKLSKCSDCLREFKDREDLFWHCRTTHFQLRLHKCPECEVMSLDESQIIKHISSAHKKRGFKCWACDMAFDVEETLIQHFEDQHFL